MRPDRAESPGSDVVINLFVRPFLDDQWSWYHETHRTISQTARTNKKRLVTGASDLCSGRRPTDLCATALFSFQGTDAAAKPITGRITDRTVGARRQSQRKLIYHPRQAKSSLLGQVSKITQKPRGQHLTCLRAPYGANAAALSTGGWGQPPPAYAKNVKSRLA